jgi:hypothetical protein
MNARTLGMFAALVAWPIASPALDVYHTDFEGLTVGETLPSPGRPGQDGWIRGGAHAGQYGEIQNQIALDGQAYHHHTGDIVRQGQGAYDQRPLASPDLTANPYVILSLDYYCVTSDLDATNFFGAGFYIYNLTDPVAMMIGCDLRGPGPRRPSGVSLVMDQFGGSGNPPLPLSVGQHLAYDTWHHMQLVTDEASGNYVALTVDGATQLLTGHAMPRIPFNGEWVRGTHLHGIQTLIFGGNTDQVQTSDDVYWDNVVLRVAPAAPAGGCCLPTGECFIGPQEVCALLAGSTYFGDGTTCEAQPCPCTVCPPNDACADAIEVAVPSTTAASTALARNDDEAPACAGTSPETAPGVWYKLVGTGTRITVTTCGGPQWDGQLAVYCGDCGNLSCVGGNDDGCQPPGFGQPSTFRWCAAEGVTYLIRVYGWGGATGNFVLEVSEDGVACLPTDPCAPPVGACCLGATCVGYRTIEQCTVLGGVYQGDGSDCFPNLCTRIDFWYDSVGDQGGFGWSGGAWLTYPSNWITQWYLSEYDLARQQRVDLKFWIGFAGPAPTVAVNYTIDTYTDPDFPPFDDPPIVRVPVSPPVTTPGYYVFTALLPVCPRWVSVEAMKTEQNDFAIQGTIDLACMTGPTTGACCVGIICTDDVSAADCATLGGNYKGDGSICDPVPTACYGDADCSTEIDFDDINYFVAALAGGETGWTNYYTSKHGGTPPPCTLWNCDADGSGRCADPQAPEVDFDDISPFVAKLVAPPACP